MSDSRFRAFGVFILLFLFAWVSLAAASTNTFEGFVRWSANGGWLPVVNNEAYFRDASILWVTRISDATDGEPWGASATLPDGTSIQNSSLRFYKQYGGQTNCFVGFGTGDYCNATSVTVYWPADAQCQPKGVWTWSFTNNGSVFATPQMTLLAEVPDVPLLNQGNFAGKKYDNICYVEQKGADGKIHKVTVPCSTPGATPWDIKAKGCMLVDAAMVLQYHGVTVGADGKPVTVENLDAWLSDPKNRGYDKDGGLDLRTLSKYSQGLVSLDRVTGADDTTLRNSLCEFGPVIIRVNSPRTGEADGHSVVAIGRDDSVNPTTWQVNDSDSGVVTTLSDKAIYDNKYYGLRIFQGPEKTIFPLHGITIKLFSPAELLVADFQGRRTGCDPIT